MANNSLVDLEGVAEIRDWVKANFLTIANAQQMMASKLKITFGSDFVGQTYTITGGASETYTGTVPDTMIVEQTIKTLDTNYTVSATNANGGEFSRTIPVGNFYGVYSGELLSFVAYLSCTSDANATITATSGAKTYTGVADSTGACTLTVGVAGTYSVTATLNGETTAPVSAEVTTMGETVEVKLPSLLLTIVSWADGTDDEIAAMLDAAKAGTIDLQTDGGWKVGDVRTIKIAAFTGGGSTNHAEQSIDIVISSFENYNNSGSVMQFDFKDELATAVRMNPSNTNSGGYGASEMYKTTLPALVNALPEWLRTRLLEFSVLASAGSQSSTINTVTGNKLALRSEVEIFGKTTYSKAGEGTQIEYYKTAANRIKKRGHNGSAYIWWERSPNGSDSSNFCNVASDGSAGTISASNTRGVAPFGCI